MIERISYLSLCLLRDALALLARLGESDGNRLLATPDPLPASARTKSAPLELPHGTPYVLLSTLRVTSHTSEYR